MEAAALVADGAASWISVMVEIIDFTPNTYTTHTHTPPLLTVQGSYCLLKNFSYSSHVFVLQAVFMVAHGSPSGATG